MFIRSAVTASIASSLAIFGLTPIATAEPGNRADPPTAAVVGQGSQSPTKTGFVSPFSGTPRFQKWAPKKLRHKSRINQPLGQHRADKIARKIGLKKKHVFTPQQYRRFISGKGVGGDKTSAKLVDASVRILTNTVGRPLRYRTKGKVHKTVLASYGLMVNKKGLLQSPANSKAPTRKVNVVLEPGGYLGTWARANGAKKSLRILYRSAYTSEAVYGNQAQQQSGVAQLVQTNKKGHKKAKVGMSMAPALWIVNFALIYTLNPELAALMPARWQPIPKKVSKAILASPTGQVPYKRYKSLLE